MRGLSSIRQCETRTMAHRAFGSRLRWHCHFIQKFDPSTVLDENINRGFNELPHEQNKENLERWYMVKQDSFRL